MTSSNEPRQNPPYQPAPLALFAYKRPRHLQRTLASLSANPQASQSELFVFCDAARSAADEAAVREVRELVTATTGFARLTPVLRESNLGLARSIVDGVTRVLRSHDRVIVIEDDLLLSPHFLRYMNAGLERYAKNHRVASIHGYRYPGPTPLPETFFLRGADCWGWATWSRAWRHFEPDGGLLLSQLRERRLTRAFDLDDSFPYTRMLEDQVAGLNDSWAIRWHASCFLKDLLTLYPGRTLVENIGNDSSGTHSATTAAFSAEPTGTPVAVSNIPIEESSVARAAFRAFHRGHRSILSRVRSVAARALSIGQ